MASGITVTFTQGLIEKLAGIKQPPAPQPTPTPGHVSGRPLIHPEVLALSRQDAQLSRALASSRRVGNALLKQEVAEEEKVKEFADDLLKQYNVAARPLPCQTERETCLDCYTKHPQEPLHCAEAVDAYSQCAEQAFHSRVQQATATATAKS